MRIGILGGTFDPPHEGHVILAQIALRELKLDSLYVVPAGHSPFKSKSPNSSSSHRFRMVRLAFGGIPRIKISSFEIKQKGYSYSYKTVLYFKRRFSESQLILLMGSDTFRGLKRWKNWKEIFQICRFGVVPRKGIQRRDSTGLGDKIVWLHSKIPNISSTQVRQKLQKGYYSLPQVPLEVRRYIRKHRLYES